MRQAVVLVGGLGTRLGAFTQSTPKPLLQIDEDRCFLDYLIEQLTRHGVSEIILIAGHLGEQVEARYGQSPPGCEVIVVREPAPAGTAGALQFARDLLDPVFLMMNGDSFFDVNLLALTSTLAETDLAALALRHVPDASRYGAVEHADGRVLAFREKQAAGGGAWISAGVYAVRRTILDHISTPPCSIEVDVFPALAAAGQLAARPLEGYFIDIGLPDTLAQGRRELPQVRRRPAIIFGPDVAVQLDPLASLHPAGMALTSEAVAAIRAANDLGWFAVVAIDRPGPEPTGYLAEDVRRLQANLQARLAPYGAHIDAIYHRDPQDSAAPGLATDSPLRRDPDADTLGAILRTLPIDAARSLLIYDQAADSAAAQALGLRTRAHAPGGLTGDVTAADLPAAARLGAG